MEDEQQPKPKGPGGRPRYEPNDEHRAMVEAFAVIGVSQDIMSKALGISRDLIERHYRKELDVSAATATAKVGGALFRKAMNGDTAAQIFWMKTRGGWRETNRTEVTGAGGGAITLIERVIVDPVMNQTAPPSTYLTTT